MIKMNLSNQLAKDFRNLHFGGNWTYSNLKDNLEDVTWVQANSKITPLNSILALTYHIHYFVKVTLKVLEGGPLDAHDKFSFDHPKIESQTEWETFLDEVWRDANAFADRVEKLPDEKLWETFSEEKYGNYYRNIQGIIEHSHYHLGQIVVIKKMLSVENEI